MKKWWIALICLLLSEILPAQEIPARIAKAYKIFENDPQLKNAISSLYIIEAGTGKVIFDKNSRTGLAPASTQKVITSITALDMLGKDYRYATGFYYDGTISNGVLDGSLYIKGSGDPAFGSWRYGSSLPESIDRRLLQQLQQAGIRRHRGSLVAVTGTGETGKMPDGWIWQDIGNYYGAAPAAVNWNENQYDLHMRPGKKEGDSVALVRTEPVIPFSIINELSSGPKSSGDNAYLYFVPGSQSLYVKGTVPCCVETFKISGAVPDGNRFALEHFAAVLKQGGVPGENGHPSLQVQEALPEKAVLLFTHQSPSLDSIIYWFNKKSINLYGEALIKTIAVSRDKMATTRNGAEAVKAFWKEKGLDAGELNIYDGSGLSPQNRVTTHAQVAALQYAHRQSWYPSFYDALPEYNGMKMKSGTINDVKGFCGYHRSKAGKEYIFSFLVNNYDGRASSLVSKMYRVLDELK